MSSMFDVARVGDPCVGPTGKSGVITTGSSQYFVEGRMAARLGDTVTYTDGTSTVIAEGSTGLRVGGRPVALQGHRLADGGRILKGSQRSRAGTPAAGRNTGAERTLVAARERAQGLVPVDCAARVAHAFAAADGAAGPPEPAAAPPQAAAGPPVAVDADLPAGNWWDSPGAA